MAEKKLDVKVPCFVVSAGSGRKAVALAAANFYKKPAAELVMLGVTGTNGKTTTTYLLHQLLNSAGIRCGLIGTVSVVHAAQKSLGVSTGIALTRVMTSPGLSSPAAHSAGSSRTRQPTNLPAVMTSSTGTRFSFTASTWPRTRSKASR